MWRDKSVMVVEDDEGIRDFLGRALGTELGAYTVVAMDGGEALTWAGRLRPSVVVLDLLLPTVDGYEVARRIKADPQTAPAWIIAVSAATPTSEVRQRALEAGCDDFLPKPFRAEELLDRVRERLLAVDSSPAG
jgi:two-component system response regulator MtrA